MSGILLTDGLLRKTLVAARALGRRHERVIVSEVTRAHATAFSRYVARSYLSPSPQDTAPFVAFVCRVLRREGCDVLIPMDDASTGAFVGRSDVPAATLLPEEGAYRTLTDKRAVLEAGRGAGVPVPRVYADTSGEGLRRALDETGGRLVAKPVTGSGGRGIRTVADAGSLPAPPFVLVEQVPFGRKFDVGLLYGPGGDLRAAFAQEELRWFPGEKDASTIQESVWRPDLVSLARRVVESVGWRGPAEVEFMEVDGVPWLLEVNTRYWASLGLAVAAGVDFPALHVDLARGKDVSAPERYAAGLRCRWSLPADLLHFLSHPLRQVGASRLPRAPLGTVDDTWAVTDPGPVLGFAASALRYAFDPDMWRLFFRWGS